MMMSRSRTLTTAGGVLTAGALVLGTAAATAAPQAGADKKPRSYFTMAADGSTGASVKGKKIPNIDSVKATIRTYYGAGADGIANKTASPYINEVKTIQAAQASYLDQAFAAATTAGKVPAIVVDVDDTTLWNYDMEDGAMKFDFDPALQDVWVQGKKFPAVPGMVDFVNAAEKKGFAIFGLTGRNADQEAATLGNLKDVGYTSFTADNLFTKWTGKPGSAQPAYVTCAVAAKCTTVEYKAGTRKHIETELKAADGKAYDVVLNVGDQWSDLMGGYADKTVKLPNPTYYLPSANLPGVSEPALQPRVKFFMKPDGTSGTTVGGEGIPNMDSAKATIRTYYNAKDGIAGKNGWSSPYIKQVKARAKSLGSYVAGRCKELSKKKYPRTPAVAFDVYDTLLWTYDLRDAGMSFDHDPALWNTWVREKKFDAVPKMKQVVRKAKNNGCVVIALSEGDQPNRTRKNLNKFYGDRFSKKWVFTGVSDKAAQRKALTEQRNLRIIRMVGDQYSDLTGGYADKVIKIANPTTYVP